MALTAPLDLLTGFPGWSTSFDLMARQEQSRHASGRTRVKDFGQPIWRASYVTRSLSPNLLDRWRALTGHAMVSQKSFKAIPLSRCRPALHPGASVLPVGELHTIGADNASVRVADLTGVALSVGDMLRIGGALYRALETATGDPTNTFAIEPHLWPGAVETDDVVIDHPYCLMTIDPGSVSANADPRTGRGSISFTATEIRA